MAAGKAVETVGDQSQAPGTFLGQSWEVGCGRATSVFGRLQVLFWAGSEVCNHQPVPVASHYSTWVTVTPGEDLVSPWGRRSRLLLCKDQLFSLTPAASRGCAETTEDREADQPWRPKRLILPSNNWFEGPSSIARPALGRQWWANRCEACPQGPYSLVYISLVYLCPQTCLRWYDHRTLEKTAVPPFSPTQTIFWEGGGELYSSSLTCPRCLGWEGSSMEPPWRRVMDAGLAILSLVAMREVGRVVPATWRWGSDLLCLLSDPPSTTLWGNQCPGCTSSSLLATLESGSFGT